MNWLRNKLRRWLGITHNLELIRCNEKAISELSGIVHATDQRTKDLVNIGVDVHFKEPHMILIYSKLNGGQLRHISVAIDNTKELQQMVQTLKERYGTRETTWDKPRHWLW